MLLSRKYTLSITDPCLQSWDKMHPAGKGRFCDSCAKSVIDFTEMTEKEITAYFRSRPANVCGRFRTGQMEATYVQRPQIRVPFHRRFLGYLLSLFVSNAVIGKAAAQDTAVAVLQTDTLAKLTINDTLPNDLCAGGGIENFPVADDSLKLTWDPDWAKSTQLETTIEWTVVVTTVMGMVAAPVYEEPSFLDLCKLKIRDSISKYIKAPVQVAENDLPAPEKAPLKPVSSELNAVLPEEVKRRSERGS